MRDLKWALESGLKNRSPNLWHTWKYVRLQELRLGIIFLIALN